MFRLGDELLVRLPRTAGPMPSTPRSGTCRPRLAGRTGTIRGSTNRPGRAPGRGIAVAVSGISYYWHTYPDFVAECRARLEAILAAD